MLKKLRKNLADKTDALKALQEKAFGEAATKEDVEALKSAIAEIKELKESIKMAEDAEALVAEASLPANDPIDDNNGGQRRAPAQPAVPVTPQQKIGVIIMGMVKGHKDHGQKGRAGLVKGLEDLGYGGMADVLLSKALNSVSSVQGGLLVSETLATDIIPILYPLSSFFEGGPRRIPMPQGSYRQVAGASSATAAYTAEGANIVVSQPTFKDINMTAHKLAGIVPITNELLQYSLGAAEDFVRADLAQVMSNKADSAAYLGTGFVDEPIGIFNQPGILKVVAYNSTTPSAAQVDATARTMLNAVVRFPVLLNKLEWRMAQTTLGYLQDMRDGNNNLIYEGLQGDNPTFKGYRVRVANFPENLGGGTNETYMALISFSNVLYGEARGLELAVSDEATIIQNGTAVSMFSTDSTAIRAITSHDFGLRYNEAVVLATAVKWGK